MCEYVIMGKDGEKDGEFVSCWEFKEVKGIEN